MQLVEEYQEAITDAQTLLQLGENKVKDLIADFDNELIKRKTFTYTTEENAERNKALTSFKRAKNFVNEIDKICHRAQEWNYSKLHFTLISFNNL